ncbi:MAG: hypothetical protein Q9222_004890 [Ikaeria aurantiellina]
MASDPRTSRPDRLEGKVAIVTGSSSGLGRAIAVAYASESVSLVICADLHPIAKGAEFGAESAGTPTHELIQQRYGPTRAIFVQTNFTVGTEMEHLVQEAVRMRGRLDIMVNNAGIGGTERQGLVHETPEETWDLTMQVGATLVCNVAHRPPIRNVNSRSVFFGCKYACGQFLRQDPHSSGHRVWIVNTASIMGLVGQPDGAAYCASKGAVVQLTRNVAVGYAKFKIHYLRTPMTQGQFEDPKMRSTVSAMTPWGDEWGDPQDVARVAVFLASDDAAYVTGVPLPVDGGYTAQ